MNVKQLINELPCLIKVHGDENYGAVMPYNFYLIVS